jgi:hypothetical protein
LCLAYCVARGSGVVDVSVDFREPPAVRRFGLSVE